MKFYVWNEPKTLFFMLVLPLFYLTSLAQPQLNYKPAITGLTSPIDIVNANDGSNRLFIVQQNGIIKLYDQALSPLGNFLTVSGIATGGERGLLSMAFHPDYKTNGLLFVYYTNSGGNIEIAKYKVSGDPNVADASSKTIIITIPHPGATNHNGGKLNFGTDGYLYFATGDGGNGGDPPNNAQNGNSLLGKMIRIDINNTIVTTNYSIPADNPFTNDPAIADEIWSLGLRNPWRWSFDRLTNDMWIADVGQAQWEEINFRKSNETKGLNYGWRCYEGLHNYNTAGCQAIGNYVSPVFEYPHNTANGGFSVTGGFVYRGAEYPALNGFYIFADYVTGNQWMTYDSNGVLITKKQTGSFPANLSSFGEAEDGTLYACALSTGIIYKIEAITSVEFQLLNFSAVARNNTAELTWSTSGEQNLLQYEIEKNTDSIHFEIAGIVTAKNEITNSYSFVIPLEENQKTFFRLRIADKDGQWDYSNTIAVMNNSGSRNFIYPSVITDGVINCFLSVSYDYLQVFSMNGSIVMKKNLGGVMGRVDIPISHFAKGIYLVRISNAGGQQQQKIFVR